MQVNYSYNCLKVNSLFENNLPKYPYATNNFNNGLYRHKREKAKDFKYIQFNPSNSLGTLVIDIDRDTYPEDLSPSPNIAIYNKDNSKSHAIYFLDPSVHLNELSSRKPVAYAESVLIGLTHRLQGDKNYSHLICKNPLNDSYRTYGLREQTYGLDELSEYIPDKILKVAPKNNQFYGRNCYVFDQSRHWAYIAIREYKNKTYKDFYNAVLSRCFELNIAIQLPMTINEIKNIAKSISKWVWDRRQTITDFSKQRARANKLAAKRKLQLEENRKIALEMFGKGFKMNQIAETLGVTMATIWNYLNPK